MLVHAGAAAAAWRGEFPAGANGTRASAEAARRAEANPTAPTRVRRPAQLRFPNGQLQPAPGQRAGVFAPFDHWSISPGLRPGLVYTVRRSITSKQGGFN